MDPKQRSQNPNKGKKKLSSNFSSLAKNLQSSFQQAPAGGKNIPFSQGDGDEVEFIQKNRPGSQVQSQEKQNPGVQQPIQRPQGLAPQYSQGAPQPPYPQQMPQYPQQISPQQMQPNQGAYPQQQQYVPQPTQQRCPQNVPQSTQNIPSGDYLPTQNMHPPQIPNSLQVHPPQATQNMMPGDYLPTQNMAQPPYQPTQNMAQPPYQPTQNMAQPPYQPTQNMAQPPYQPTQNMAQPPYQPTQNMAQPPYQPTQNMAQPTQNMQGENDKTVNLDTRRFLGEQSPTIDKTANFSPEEMAQQRKMSQQEFGQQTLLESPAMAKTRAQKAMKTGQKDPFFLLHSIIKNKYEITKFIGQGGMGAVYLGKHKMLGKERAIKTLLKSSEVDPKLVQRFFNEARAAAAVEHPNVVQVHDIDETDEYYFIVMEYVEGESLDHTVRRNGILPCKEAAKIISLSALGLSAIHDAGLVHRDVKPGNLLKTPQGEIKITDFGIVKEIGTNAELTGSAIVGTPQFMAPEQITKAEIDCRTDIYSLGATLYTLVTNRPCFSGSAMQLIYQVLQSEAIPPHEINKNVDREISDIIMKMMAKQSSLRYQNMNEVHQVLKTYCQK